FLVDKDLWEELDNDNKVALIFHEIIYAEAISYGHLNSLMTRSLNIKLLTSSNLGDEGLDRLFAQNLPPALDEEELYERIYQHRLPLVQLQSILELISKY